jgi:hypothetical protein
MGASSPLRGEKRAKRGLKPSLSSIAVGTVRHKHIWKKQVCLNWKEMYKNQDRRGLNHRLTSCR